MWALDFFPDWVFHIILLVGIAGLVLSWVAGAIPFIGKNQVAVQLVAVLLTIVGIWYEGGIAKDAHYRQEIAALKLKVAESEKKSGESNTKIEYRYRDRIKIVHDKQKDVQEKILVDAPKTDQCKVAPEAIENLNEAARTPGVAK